MPVKPRCTFKECRTAAQRIVGDCGFCDGHFCAKHRLLEDHKCTGLEDSRSVSSARRSRTSATPHNSRPRGHKSSGVCKATDLPTYLPPKSQLRSPGFANSSRAYGPAHNGHDDLNGRLSLLS
ncbi:hypothetical protein EV127DRAFT_106346 [Xylaria flabelliformis]|nr:hypothetical protein EV127DRAFT_106346 [Xylaria flabelliformis]